MRIVPENRRRVSVGQRFNRLVVIGEPFYCRTDNARDALAWVVYRCDCGTAKATRCNSLQSGHVQSCGCLQRDGVREAGRKRANWKSCRVCGTRFQAPPTGNSHCSDECAAATISSSARTHGMSHTRLHGIWCHMKSRCSGNCKSPLIRAYYSHVTLCEEWHNFETFRDWSFANGYAEYLEIDRIDPRGNYEPSNCRWATRGQQMANTRKRRDAKTSPFKGVSIHRKTGRWRAQLIVRSQHQSVGMFPTALAAALAYDKAAVEANGEFARPNFPEAFQSRRTLPF